MNDPFDNYDLTEMTRAQLRDLITVEVERNGREYTATARLDRQRICWVTDLGFEWAEEDCWREVDELLELVFAEVRAA